MNPTEIIAFVSICLALGSTIATIGIAWGRTKGKVDSSGQDLNTRLAAMEKHIEARHEALKVALDDNREAVSNNTEAVQDLNDSVVALRKDIGVLEVVHGERITRAEERIDSMLRSRRYGPHGDNGA